MKKYKTGYWILTIFFALAMTVSSFSYLSHQAFILKAMEQLHYPAYLLNILGTAKLLGVIALLQTRFSTLKEWAYAGFTINLVAAAWSHLATGESPVAPIFLLLILAGSYIYWKQILGSVKKGNENQLNKFAW